MSWNFKNSKNKFLMAALACSVLSSVGTASAQNKKLETVGISVGSLGNPYFVSLVNGATKQAQKINPQVKILSVSSEYDLGKQSSQIDSFISSGANIILLAAADPQAIGSAVNRARAAGIVVIAIDVSALNADAAVQTDNMQAGRLACAYLAEKVGSGNIVIQNAPQVSSIIERMNGCRESLAKHPDIKVLSDDQNGKVSRDGGMDVMMGHLTRFPDFKGVFTVDDPQAIGATLAAQQLHRTNIIISSVDGSPDAVNIIKSGGLIKATASQDPSLEGSMAVDIGWGLMNGKKPAKTVNLIAPQLVTQDNVAQYKGW
ncbi:ABC transporter substrate-binding protein [Kozakia baliensis]|uniref:ABC transporter n=1 Tax=Kozakia baliensis TaxID=153496 RepID=A0A1D8UQQ1_9PROT|nr:ABC transporter substrate-binding protein [Kozakia baliensis]AOX15951.1 ABC transporter [Kozakia baliensis]GEL64157.1 sugar ABC transporter substrate-binding protein [Kozakia baliensis]